MFRHLIITTRVAIVLFALPFLAGCANNAAKSGWGNQAILVQVQPAKLETVTDASVYSATAKSRFSVSLSPQIDGQIAKIFVQPGQAVKKGQPLIQINPEKQQASVNSFQSASSSSEQELNNAVQTLQSLQSQKEAKISNLKLAANNKERYATLCTSGAVSKMDYDQRVNSYEIAASELASTERQIDAQKASIARIKHMVHQSVANLKEQQVQLQYFTIKAPFDGVVGEIPVKLGNYVDNKAILTTVTKNDPLEIYVELPVEKTHDVTKSTVVEVLDQRDQLIGTSRVFFIAPNVSPDSQTVLVKAEYANPKQNLRADQTVKARVVWNKHEGVKVPTEAISHQSGEDFLFLAEKADKKDSYIAKQIAVKLGDIEDSKYQVLKGVKPGDKVIVSGVQNLADKAAITVTQ